MELATRVKKEHDDNFKFVDAAHAGDCDNVYTLTDAKPEVEVNETRSATSLIAIDTSNVSEPPVDNLRVADSDINYNTEERSLDLIRAVKLNHVDTVKMLLDAKVNIDVANSHGFTAFTVAAGEGRTACLQMLLDAKADINAVDKSGYTALIAAAGCGQTACLQFLLDLKADVSTLVIHPDAGTALVSAACNGRSGCLQLLLEAKADIAATDDDGLNATRSGFRLHCVLAVNARRQGRHRCHGQLREHWINIGGEQRTH